MGVTVTAATYGGGGGNTNLFDGVSVSWGFTPGDVFSNGLFLVGSVAMFVLLGLAIKYVPILIYLIRNGVALRHWREEAGAMAYERRHKKRGYYYMTGDQERRAERRNAWRFWE